MEGAFMHADGRGVDYARLAGSDTFREYRQATRALPHVTLHALTDQQRTALFISVISVVYS